MSEPGEGSRARVRRVDPAERLLSEHQGLIRSVAGAVSRQIGGCVPVDDLMSVGRAAFLEAARVHDPERAPLERFAAKKMRWAMLDAVRRETHGRWAAARSRALSISDRVAEAWQRDEAPRALADVAEAPDDEVRARFRGLIAGQAAALAVGLACEPDRAASLDAADPDANPEAQLLRRRTSERVRSAVARLPGPQRALVEGHYFQGERFDEIAARLGLSKSWASRLHAKAIATLGRALCDHEPGAV
jgi:RNA polymerase sigma factor for flagellar operon FliA